MHSTREQAPDEMKGLTAQFFKTPTRRPSEVGQVLSSSGDLPGVSSAERRSLRAFSFPERRQLSKYERKEISRRAAILESYEALRKTGATTDKICRELRVKPTSLWRYRQRIAPLTARCGRRSMLERLQVSHAVILKVQQLQLTGLGNAAAWGAFAEHEDCPPALARFLRGSPSIPPSLLRASKLIRIKITALVGVGFVFYTQPKRKR